MKRGDMIFWGVLAAIASFYLLKGNDMYKERFEMLEAKKMQNNITKQN